MAPDGWHIPSLKGWSDLMDFFWGSTESLKAKHGWDVPNQNGLIGLNGTNKSGFTGLPAGAVAIWEHSMMLVEMLIGGVLHGL